MDNTDTKKNKHRMGRPTLIKSVKDLEEKVTQYFNDYSGLIILKDEDGKIITDDKKRPIYQLKPPTIAGLALKLGFADRHSIYDYINRNENQDFANIIKRAVVKIEEFAESQLYGGKPVGAIFWLKNHRWQDKTEIEHSGDININVNGIRKV